MSFAAKELLAAQEGFVSNFIVAESTPAVIKNPTKQLVVNSPPPPPPSSLLHHKLYWPVLKLF